MRRACVGILLVHFTRFYILAACTYGEWGTCSAVCKGTQSRDKTCNGVVQSESRDCNTQGQYKSNREIDVYKSAEITWELHAKRFTFAFGVWTLGIWRFAFANERWSLLQCGMYPFKLRTTICMTQHNKKVTTKRSSTLPIFAMLENFALSIRPSVCEYLVTVFCEIAPQSHKIKNETHYM